MSQAGTETEGVLLVGGDEGRVDGLAREDDEGRFCGHCMMLFCYMCGCGCEIVFGLVEIRNLRFVSFCDKL